MDLQERADGLKFLIRDRDVFTDSRRQRSDLNVAVMTCIEKLVTSLSPVEPARIEEER
jgi:hypothetical protein